VAGGAEEGIYIKDGTDDIIVVVGFVVNTTVRVKFASFQQLWELSATKTREGFIILVCSTLL
jgi:hypothetical protein